jgi:HD superfamily phosphohydrolase
MDIHNYNSKILNDPVYGFISLPYKILLDVIDHPYFQRLRRIKQLGLSHLVYPGAMHTRFQHSIGCTHLMLQAVSTLRNLGKKISVEEEKGVCLAILLHDIGHSPFSHTLENSIVCGINHEGVSKIFMQALNKEFNGQLDIAISIFSNEYHKCFLHELVSSQLDMDRLDYLKRDSFFTGVSEGIIGNERIIKMFDIVNDSIVIKQKGIYSIEKFLVARRLMYWQVYLHKTVLSAEFLLMNILKRAKEIALSRGDIFTTSSLKIFLYRTIDSNNLKNINILNQFANLDDYEIFTNIKEWINDEDLVLSKLSYMLVNRKLLKVKMGKETFNDEEIEILRSKCIKTHNLNSEEVKYFVFQTSMTNNAYDTKNDEIKILYKDGQLLNITEASDNYNIQSLSSEVKKHYLFYPAELSI